MVLFLNLFDIAVLEFSLERGFLLRALGDMAEDRISRTFSSALSLAASYSKFPSVFLEWPQQKTEKGAFLPPASA